MCEYLVTIDVNGERAGISICLDLEVIPDVGSRFERIDRGGHPQPIHPAVDVGKHPYLAHPRKDVHVEPIVHVLVPDGDTRISRGCSTSQPGLYDLGSEGLILDESDEVIAATLLAKGELSLFNLPIAKLKGVGGEMSGLMGVTEPPSIAKPPE